MSLDRTRYEALVRRMEEFAQRSPRLYRWWILALAALGYAYLLVLVVALLALLVASVYGLRTATAMLSVKLFFVVGALLLVVLRSLWVTLKPPGGEPLAPRDAPAFFERLDQLSARLKAPRIHDVLITEDFNAAVCQMPRLGVFGWHRNYLLVGLPLMKCLTVPQLEAVLAHELGHLSRGHARVGNWIYRLRLVWQRLDEAFAAKPRRGAGVIRAFLRWYIPYFAGCSFPLARNNEFEADASSVQFTSPLAAAQALTNVSVLGSYLHQRYWPAINAGARDSAQPAFAPFSALNAATLALSAAEAQPWLAQALGRATTYEDTHPSLKARLDAIGMTAQLALPAADASADRLLGARGESLAQTFDSRWRERVATPWQKVYEDTQKKRERLRALREQAAPGPLDTGEGLELATLEADVGEGPAHALLLFRELVARDPGSHAARFGLARQLLLQGDGEGVAIMEAVMQVEQQAVLPGSQLLRDYWWQQGNADRARHWHERTLERGRQLQQIKAQRGQIRAADIWLEHGLPPAALQALVEGLKQISGLRRAWLVRRQVQQCPEEPVYVLGFETAMTPGAETNPKQVMERLRADVEYPGETVILRVSAENAMFGRKFCAVPNSRIL
jgi:Zn-dependent protease with chaperone function